MARKNHGASAKPEQRRRARFRIPGDIAHTEAYSVAQALLPGGVKDLSNPEKVIFSVPPEYRS